jgi:hypothetical protein
MYVIFTNKLLKNRDCLALILHTTRVVVWVSESFYENESLKFERSISLVDLVTSLRVWGVVSG